MIRRTSVPLFQEYIDRVSLVVFFRQCGFMVKPQGSGVFTMGCFLELKSRHRIHINESRRVMHCFKCRRGGYLTLWLQQAFGIGFPEAVEMLRTIAMDQEARTKPG